MLAMSRKIASILHFRIFLLLFLSLPLNNILVLVAQPPSSVTVGQPAVAPTRASFRGGNPGGMGRSLTSSRASSATINSSIASSVNFTTHDELHLLSSSDTPVSNETILWLPSCSFKLFAFVSQKCDSTFSFSGFSPCTSIRKGGLLTKAITQ